MKKTIFTKVVEKLTNNSENKVKYPLLAYIPLVGSNNIEYVVVDNLPDTVDVVEGDCFFVRYINKEVNLYKYDVYVYHNNLFYQLDCEYKHIHGEVKEYSEKEVLELSGLKQFKLM